MRYKRKVCVFAVTVFFMNFCFNPIGAMGKTNTTSLYDSSIGQGISYTKKVVSDASIKKVLNIITCDLNNSSSSIIFSKAKDIEKREEVLSKQIQREVFKGNNVVAGINADMFDMGIGFSSGPQIKDGAIITNHNAKYEENIYPVFGIDKDKKAFISYVHMDAKLMLQNTISSEISVTTNGAINSANAITLDSINRENCKDKLVLSNIQLNQNGVVDISPYASVKGPFSMAVIKGISTPLKLGEEYEGIVVSIGADTKTASIPADGALLYGSGTKAKWINSHLKPGDRFKVSVSYDRDNIEEAVGAYTYFLRDGRVLTNDEMIKAGAKAELVHARKARTAVGITANNKVIAITVDGGKPSQGISDGITLLEMANLLKSMGAVNGVGFDGGGSTEMNVKLYGEKNVNIITRPSDGRERAITNGVMFISNNQNSYQIKNISLNDSIVIYKNTTYKFNVSGIDTNYNPLNLSNAAVYYSADPGIGSIDANGVFTSGSSAGAGSVAAVVGGASATTSVRVVDNVSSIKLTDDKVTALQYGINKKFSFSAKDDSGNPVIINNNAVSWNVSPGIGAIDKNGLLTVTAKSGTGVVTARVGSKSASANVAIMRDSEIIDDFEHNDNTRYSVNGNLGGTGAMSSDFSKSGDFSYKISYDYDKLWDRKSSGTINIVPTFTSKDGDDLTGYYTGTMKPKRLGLWVYGDGHAPLLRAEILDGDSNKRTIDLVKKIDFTGWKYIDANIPADAPEPITLKALYFIETNKNAHYKGNIYLDDIQFAYTDNIDMRGPAFSDFKPSGKVYSKDVNINVTIKDPSGVEPRSIWAKLDGRSVPVKFDENSGVLSYSSKYISVGNHTFEVKAMDDAGNSANPSFMGKFTVTDEIDNQPPSVSALQPSNNSIIKTGTPRISVKITDDKSGIDVKDINISIDGSRLKTFYDESSGWASGVASSALNAGTHKLALSVFDRAGNKRVLQPINFTVQPMQQPKDPNNFAVSVLSDSHASEFGPEFFNEASENDSELIIQNGDMIDSDTPPQWAEGLKQLGVIKNKPVVNTPGDHEASTGSINDYMKYLGMPAYSFEFGNSLFISLNSAVNQSISASDPTQFDYLKYILDKNTKNNIFIYTHVPTKDSTSVNHTLPAADASKLEEILGSYKKKNSDKNINVIFGHLHSFQSWTKDGVNYTIDGNECLKKYVEPENGSYMGYTKFFVNGANVSHKFEPMPQSIAVVDSSIAFNEMKTAIGTIKKLNLYGDFNLLSSDYITPINNIKDADIKWESDAPNIVSVSDDGVITVNSAGIANIKAIVWNKTYTLRINSIEQRDDYIAGFKVTSDRCFLKPGQSINISGMGYDIYGNSLVIDGDKIIWKAQGGLLVNGILTVPTDAGNSGSIAVTAQYKNMISKIDFKIIRAVSSSEKYAVVTATSLNIRDNPSRSGNILGKLDLGERIEILGEIDGWYLININGSNGFISNTYTKSE